MNAMDKRPGTSPGGCAAQRPGLLSGDPAAWRGSGGNAGTWVEALERPLVFTNGVFDILHAGHVACLEAARALGRSLVVGVNSDASAQRLHKGPGRPFNPAAQRARVVGALQAVSHAEIFEEDMPLELITRLRPDIYVKGGDYEEATLPEARLVARWGGRTVIVPRTDDLSTSALVRRVALARSAWA